MPRDLHPTLAAFLRALAAHMARQEDAAGRDLMIGEVDEGQCSAPRFTPDTQQPCNPSDQSMTRLTSAGHSLRRMASRSLEPQAYPRC